MIGAIIGDIVGSRFEFNNIKSKDFKLFTNDCFFTDDTVMTLAIANAFLKCKKDYSDLEEKCIDSMVEVGRMYPNCGYGGSFIRWVLSDNHEPYNSFGNGSAMRVSCCGLVGKTIEEVKMLSNIVTKVSHNHPEGIKGAEATAVSVFMAKEGRTIEEIKKYIIENYYNIDFTLDTIRNNYDFDVTCQGSVPQALEAFFESDSLEDAIRNAISIGGDSDTIGTITSSIASVYYKNNEKIEKEALKYLDDELLKIYTDFEKKFENIEMRKERKKKVAKKESSTNLGYENELWLAADKLRGSMDAGEYKHVVLGLIFLKYVSDAFESKYEELKNDDLADVEDRDEYTSENIFWVPKEARWSYIKGYANTPEIGKIIDNAMDLIEKDNPSLKNVLNKNYARPELDKTRLGELVTMFTNLDMGSNKAKEMDMLGRVYEYCISKFAAAEGKLGGEFYTPACIVRTLVEMIEPYSGRIYDPACGSGGMFVQSTKFIKAHQGNINNVSIYGQELNPTTWKLAKMNLAIRQIDGNIGTHNADTFHNDLHKTLKADYILANPPFNVSDWGGEKLKDDLRWKYGVPPTGNANYAWLQHMIHHLNPETGVAGTVLANGSLSSNTSNEGEIRKNMLNGDVIDAIVSMPSQLFYATGIPCSLWIMRKNKKENTSNKVLFIDARNLGTMIDRKVRELTDEDITKIADTYHNWRNNENYEDVLGFCKSATLEEIKENKYVLTPGRYVGVEDTGGDKIPFEEKMNTLTSELSEHIKKSQELDEELKRVLGAIGYDI